MNTILNALVAIALATGIAVATVLTYDTVKETYMRQCTISTSHNGGQFVVTERWHTLEHCSESIADR